MQTLHKSDLILTLLFLQIGQVRTESSASALPVLSKVHKVSRERHAVPDQRLRGCLFSTSRVQTILVESSCRQELKYFHTLFLSLPSRRCCLSLIPSWRSDSVKIIRMGPTVKGLFPPLVRVSSPILLVLVHSSSLAPHRSQPLPRAHLRM